MPLFLDTRGRSTAGIGICARCSRKFSLDDLMPDGNSPGLRVCFEDRDNMDPWRLAPPPPDRIALQFPRPDTRLLFDGSNELLSDIVTTQDIITEAFVQARLIVDNLGRLILNRDGNAMVAGRAGTGVYIAASVADPDLGLPLPSQASRIANGAGQLIITGEGYAFLASPGMNRAYVQSLVDRVVVNEETRKLALVPRNWGLLVGYGPLRRSLTITVRSHGIWINPIGGPTGPMFPGSIFCGPGIPYQAFAAASQPAVTYWSDVAGLHVGVTFEEQPL